MKTTMKVIGYIILVVFLMAVFGIVTRNCRRAVDVAEQEFGPETALVKYEWFINTSEILDKKLKDISIFTVNIEEMENEYSAIPRAEWDRIDKQQMNQWKMELAGIKASYNDLAAEYNARSKQFNWKVFKAENPQYRGVPETYISN